jgi:hypothetical protein
MSYKAKNTLKKKNKRFQAAAGGRTLVDSIAHKQMRRQAKRRRDDNKPKGKVEQEDKMKGILPMRIHPRKNLPRKRKRKKNKLRIRYSHTGLRRLKWSDQDQITL